MSYSNLSEEDRRHVDDLNAITAAHRKVNHPERAALENARRALEGSISAWLEEAAQRSAEVDLIEYVLDLLPSTTLAVIADPRTTPGTWQATWQARVRRYAATADDLPRNIFILDDKYLDQFFALGFDYEKFLSAKDAAMLWMTRGAKYGEAAFRRKYPRKSPALEYWCTARKLFPLTGLHADGVTEMAAEIRRWSGKSLPAAVSKDTPFGTATHDWRVVMAMQLCDVSPPVKVQYHTNLKQTFGAEMAPRVAGLTGPAASGHHALRQVALRKSMPEIEDILSLPLDIGVDYLDALLPRVSL